MIQIRVAEAADGEACAAIYRPIVETTWISFETEPPSPAEMSRRIETLLPRLPWLVATNGQGVLGYVYAGAHKARPAYRWSVDVTVYLAEAARRQGVGRRLYTVLFDILRRQGFHSAFAGIALPNDPSVGLHESLGFQPIGVYEDVGYKMGGWRAVKWWRLGLSPVSGEPTEPVAFADLRRDPAFSTWLEG
jgi:phosphinothricin acetyltransferase